MKSVKNTKEPTSKEAIPTITASKPEIHTFPASNIAELPNIEKMLAGSQNAMKWLDGYTPEIFSSALEITELSKHQFQSMHKIQEQLLHIGESFKPLLESSKVFESLVLGQSNIAKQLAGLVIELPLDGYFKSISATTNFELNLEQFTAVKTLESSYILGGTATETIRHEHLGLKISSGFEIRLSTIEAKLDDTSSKLDYLIEKDERRELLMEELIQYVKKTGSPLARITNIKYNKSSTEISLDGSLIKLRGNTNLSDICRILLSSKKSMQKIWEMEDIIQELGESHSKKNWHRAIYDAVSELNAKILVETKGNIPDFFITSMKTVVVNPKYIS